MSFRHCGTPNCTLKDHHKGACSFEINLIGSPRTVSKVCRYMPPVSSSRDNVQEEGKVRFCSICKQPGHNSRTCTMQLDDQDTLHRSTNGFQLGLSAIRKMMPSQLGVTFTGCTSQMNGYHLIDGKFYIAEFTITDVNDRKNYIMTCYSERDKDYPVTDLPPSYLLLNKTNVNWNKVDSSIYKQWLAELESNEKHRKSMKRAKAFIKEYLKSCTPNANDILIILDGNGENRKACQDELKAAGIDAKNWPRILTFDCNPDVVLSGQMLFETKDIIYTESDPLFQHKPHVKLEDLIFKPNSLLTQEMKSRVKGVYFDYCSGPPGFTKPEACRANFADTVFPFLPSLLFYMMTMASRNNKELKQYGIGHFVAPPPGFRQDHIFYHHWVRCELFTKRSKKAPTQLYKRPLGAPRKSLGNPNLKMFWNSYKGMWYDPATQHYHPARQNLKRKREEENSDLVTGNIQVDRTDLLTFFAVNGLATEGSDTQLLRRLVAVTVSRTNV